MASIPGTRRSSSVGSIRLAARTSSGESAAPRTPGVESSSRPAGISTWANASSSSVRRAPAYSPDVGPAGSHECSEVVGPGAQAVVDRLVEV